MDSAIRVHLRKLVSEGLSAWIISPLVLFSNNLISRIDPDMNASDSEFLGLMITLDSLTRMPVVVAVATQSQISRTDAGPGQ